MPGRTRRLKSALKYLALGAAVLTAGKVSHVVYLDLTTHDATVFSCTVCLIANPTVCATGRPIRDGDYYDYDESLAQDAARLELCMRAQHAGKPLSECGFPPFGIGYRSDRDGGRVTCETLDGGLRICRDDSDLRNLFMYQCHSWVQRMKDPYLAGH